MRRSGAARAVRASAPVFAALGDETRLGVLTRLAEDGPLSITTLASGTAVTRQAVTKHLVVLEGAGLVARERRGRESVFRLERGGFSEAHRWLEAIADEWDQRIARLRAHVEG